MTVMTGLVCSSECCSAQLLCVAVLDSRTTATAGFRLASTVSKSFLPDCFTIRAGLPAIPSLIYICPLAPSGQDRAPLYLINSLLSWRFRWVIFSKEVTEASSNQMRTEGVPGSGEAACCHPGHLWLSQALLLCVTWPHTRPTVGSFRDEGTLLFLAMVFS